MICYNNKFSRFKACMYVYGAVGDKGTSVHRAEHEKGFATGKPYKTRK